jgi:transposase
VLILLEFRAYLAILFGMTDTTSSLPNTLPEAHQVISSLASEVKLLKSQVHWFKTQLFGQKSERRLSSEGPWQQQPLFSPQETFPLAEETPEPSTTVTYQRGKAKKKLLEEGAGESGLRFGPEVEVQEIEIPHPDIEGLAEDEYEVVREEVTERLCQRRSSYFIKRFRRKIIKRKESPTLSVAPVPAQALPRSYADDSFLTGLIVDKVLFHLPLYRIHQRLKESGITISRSSLTHYVHTVSDLLEVVFHFHVKSIFESKTIAMDETPIKAGREPGKMKQGYFWPVYGEKDEVAFLFYPTRGHRVAHEILGTSFSGVLLSDDYGAYKAYAAQMTQVIQALCWSHTRRSFLDAAQVEPERVDEAIRQIRALYHKDAIAKNAGFSDEKLLLYRREEMAPLVDTFFDWLVAQQEYITHLPKSPFAKAVRYARDNEEGLRTFLSHPGVALDTNHVERANKVVAIGRKNYLFCTSEIGAEHLGLLYSLLYTVRLHGGNPYDYLHDVLSHIHTATDDELAKMIPRVWARRRKAADTAVN